MTTTFDEKGREIGPDGKEWAKTSAGYDHVNEAIAGMKYRRDLYTYYGFTFSGYVVREAFVAGAEWQEKRNPIVSAELLARIKACLQTGSGHTWQSARNAHFEGGRRQYGDEAKAIDAVLAELKALE